MSRRNSVRCPSCGARHSDGAEFEVAIPYRSASGNELAGVDEDGTLVLGAGEQGYPHVCGTPELRCVGCGHQWRTRRGWR